MRSFEGGYLRRLHSDSKRRDVCPSAKEGLEKKSNNIPMVAIMVVLLSVLGVMALAQQDRYTLKVPDGLAFSEFRGHEAWQVVSTSQDGDLFAATLANPVMMQA